MQSRLACYLTLRAVKELLDVELRLVALLFRALHSARGDVCAPCDENSFCLMSFASLPAAANNVFISRQLFGSDRTARVKPSGRDADFDSHSKFSAVGKLG